ncbi:MAG: enolase C-terminal domain-like protein [bacterium]
MKISNVKVTPVACHDQPILNSWGIHEEMFTRVIVEVETDAGIAGIGETHGGKKDKIESLVPDLLGKDPFNIEKLRQQFQDSLFEFSPVEIALWDIMGKATDRRVCDLLGGAVREEVPFSAYLFYKFPDENGVGVILPEEDTRSPETLVREAEEFVDKFGFKTLKLKGGVLSPELEFKTLKLLHEKFPDYKLRIDPNSVWTVETTLEFTDKLLSNNIDLEYLEDPVNGNDDMAEVRKKQPIPLSTNTVVQGFEDIKEAYDKGSVDVVLGDHHLTIGGIMGYKEMGVVCDSLGWELSMHSNNHLGISMAAMVHAGACTPHLVYDADTHYPWTLPEQDIIKGGKLKFHDGKMKIPEGKGLGVELDQDKLQEANERYRKGGWSDRDEMKKEMAEKWPFGYPRF